MEAKWGADSHDKNWFFLGKGRPAPEAAVAGRRRPLLGFVP